MKTKFSKRFFSLLLALLMVCSIIPTGIITASAATLTQSQFDSKLSSAKSLYPDGKQKGEWSINGSVVGWECHGYGRWLSWYVWGVDFANGRGANWTLYKSTSSSSSIDQLVPGDVVRYRTSTSKTYNHTIFITSISGDTIYFTDCNSDGNNTIRWNRSISKSTLNAYLKTSLYGDEAATYGYIAHYTLNTLSNEHTHSYTTIGYEAAHPHKEYKKCSCGAYIYTGKTVTLSNCAQCSTSDSKYPTPFKCRIISTTKVPAYSSIDGTSPGYIYPEDDCVIQQVYTNGWCKLTCPWSDGTTKTLYCKITEFIKMNITPSTVSAPQYAKTYLRTSKDVNIGWIDAGDKITKLATSGSMTQIVYPADSGKRCAWVDTSSLTASTVDKRYPTPFKCRTISTSNVVAYGSANGAEVGHIYPGDDCVIKEVYTNGWCKLDCPWTGGTTKTVYCKITEFVKMNITPETMKAPAYAKTYLRTDKATNIGWIDAGNSITKLATSGSMTMIVYPADVGKRCAWVDTSALAAKLSVYYNANGGTITSDTYKLSSNVVYETATNAKYVQTWTYNSKKSNGLTNASTFGLSRTGYTFNGWGTSANGGTVFDQNNADLLPTDINKNVANGNCSTTLYAMWLPNTYTVKYNANGGIGSMENSTHTYDLAKALLSNEFVREGYNFLGWATSSTATTAKYTDEQSVKNLTSTKNGTVNLYAVWAKNTYTVKYNANGGVGTMANSTYTYDTAKALTANTFTRDGYKFLGWSTDSSATIITFKDKQSVLNLSSDMNDSIILYAVWEKEAAPITVTNISVQNMPTKTAYEQNETFSSAGLSIKVNYSDGTSKTVTSGFTVSKPDMTTAGTKSVTVTYEGKTAGFNITVNKNSVDSNAPIFSVNNKTVKAGETFTVNVSVNNNPGIVCLQLLVSYDKDVLELVSATGKDFSDVAFGSISNMPFAFSWTDAVHPNNTTNGNIVELTFKVKDAAAVGTTNITLSYDEENVYNSDFENVTFETSNGTITVADSLPGDVNGDGAVNFKDLGLLQRKLNLIDVTIDEVAADVNKDGSVNFKDLGILQQYLNGGDVILK